MLAAQIQDKFEKFHFLRDTNQAIGHNPRVGCPVMEH